MTDIAKEAFASHNYGLAVEMYERNLKHQTPNLDMLIGYGDSLARCGRIRDSIDVFARCLTLAPLPPERLKNFTSALLKELIGTMTSSRHETSFSCPTCEGTLYQPVTAGCGHTHCRNCYEPAKCCRACGQKLGPIGETNVLVQRLVEKWWPREAEASRARHEGDHLLKDGHPSEALERYNFAVRLDFGFKKGTTELKHLTRFTLAKRVDLSFKEIMAEIQDKLSGVINDGGYVCTTADMWSSNARRYLGVTVSWIESKTYKRKSAAIACRRFSGTHSFDAIAKLLSEIHASFELVVDSIQATVTDNASNFSKAFKEFGVGSYDDTSLAPNSPLHLSNRANVLLLLNRPQAALADADHAVRLRPDWGKGHYRRGVALSALGRHEEAFFALCTCVAIDRNPQSVRHELTRVLHRVLSPNLRRQSAVMSRSPYNVLGESNVRMRRARDHHHHYRVQRPLTSPNQRHRHAVLNSSDCEDNNSSEEEFTQAICRGIPQGNTKLHATLDRVYQEIEKLKRVDSMPAEILLPPLSASTNTSDLDCILCCRSLWKPVTTPCGHTYCWMCLDRCLDYSSACPLCVTSLADYLASNQKTLTDFIERALMTIAPNEYASRAASHRLELIQDLGLLGSRHIAVFICTTAFPCVACPLFVYEPRYRLMVRRCLESGIRHFGIAASLNREATGNKRYAEYGTVLEIRDRVLMKDGCSILSTVGGRRFRVLSGGERDGYDTAEVELIRDTPIQPDNLQNLRELHDKVWSKGKKWWSTVSITQQIEIQRVFGNIPIPEDDWIRLPDGPSWTWWILAILPLGPQLQIGILGTTTLEKRLRAIEKTLNHMEKRQLTITAAPSEETTTSSSICQNGNNISESAVSMVHHS